MPLNQVPLVLHQRHAFTDHPCAGLWMKTRWVLRQLFRNRLAEPSTPTGLKGNVRRKAFAAPGIRPQQGRPHIQVIDEPASHQRTGLELKPFKEFGRTVGQIDVGHFHGHPLHPSTTAAAGLEDKRHVRLKLGSGEFRPNLAVHPGVKPGSRFGLGVEAAQRQGPNPKALGVPMKGPFGAVQPGIPTEGRKWLCSHIPNPDFHRATSAS